VTPDYDTLSCPAERRIVDRHRAEAAGVDPAELRQTDSGWAAECLTYERWAEQKLPGGWVAAFRLSVQGRRVVVSELRVFPDAWAHGQRPVGSWSGTYLGTDDHPKVPFGGLSSKTWRAIRVAEPLRRAQRLMRELRQRYPETFETWPHLRGLPGRKRPQPAAIPLREMKRLCRVYVAALPTGKPVQAVARTLGITPAAARQRIFRARERGYLVDGPDKRGVSGGRVAPRLAKSGTAARRRA
jgi:hypothetical protein